MNFKNLTRTLLITTLAMGAFAGNVPAAHAQESSGNGLSAGLQTFLNQDIQRRKDAIVAQKEAIKTVRELLRVAQNKRLTSIVVNSLEVAGAVWMTKELMKVFTKAVGTSISVSAGVIVAGEAITSVIIRFKNVSKLEASLTELEKTLTEDEADLDALQDSFRMLGSDAKAHLRQVVASRLANLQEDKATLAEMNADLATAKKTFDRATGYKVTGKTISWIAIVGGAAAFGAAKLCKDWGSLFYGGLGFVGIGTGFAGFSITNKLYTVSETTYQSLVRQVEALSVKVQIEERLQNDFSILLNN